MPRTSYSAPSDYGATLKAIKQRVQQERVHVVLAANSAMVLLYWDIGRLILERQIREGWGAKVIDRLARDLRKSFPYMQGFSSRNLLFMRRFAEEFPDAEIVKQLVSQLPWGHLIRRMQRANPPNSRQFEYVLEPESRLTFERDRNRIQIDCDIPILGINMPNMGKLMRTKTTVPRLRAGKAPHRPTSIADALFSTTQQRVMGYLFGQPERSFFASELIGLAGSGSGAVQRELARLVESGLIKSHEVGRQRHYQANVDAPIYDELRSIVVKTSGVASPLRAALEPLADRIKFAMVYGSVAKGSARSSSDIDLLIVGDGLLLEDLYKTLASAEKQLARKINPTLYTKTEFAQRLEKKNAFLTKVLAGAQIPLIGDVRGAIASR